MFNISAPQKMPARALALVSTKKKCKVKSYESNIDYTNDPWPPCIDPSIDLFLFGNQTPHFQNYSLFSFYFFGRSASSYQLAVKKNIPRQVEKSVAMFSLAVPYLRSYAQIKYVLYKSMKHFYRNIS